MTFNRRIFIGGLLGGVAAAVAGSVGATNRPPAPFRLSESEWRRRLSPAAYRVLREADTEPPFTSPLLREHRHGNFACAGCALPLYSSATKYDSGTGWPSFWQPLNGAIATSVDYEVGYPRTEVHCRRCAGHLGHVFDDGPRPTGKRYCMNGLALTFQPGVA